MKFIAAKWYARTRERFDTAVLSTLDRRVTPAKELHATVVRTGISISERTMARWLKELPIRSLVQSGERLYGLPPKGLQNVRKSVE